MIFFVGWMQKSFSREHQHVARQGEGQSLRKGPPLLATAVIQLRSEQQQSHSQWDKNPFGLFNVHLRYHGQNQLKCVHLLLAKISVQSAITAITQTPD